MAKKHKEIEKIEQIRKRISRITELIALEKPVITIMRENPAATVIIILIAGILTALISKNIVKALLTLISFGLKLVAFFYFLKQGAGFLRRIKRL